ncbi:E3 ubiquitin-protein ligase APD2-like isoform X1 [Musa acuminata AAA Group]|uniref:E3 ubiquitin-protein ligase APD2-like isoform X1 n=1 Tax=Musa acuminata AAA Group TaxID=214697 RepID=UPI0031D4FE22
MDAPTLLLLPASSSPSLPPLSPSSSSQPSPPPPPPRRPSISYRIGISITNATSRQARDDAWSCLVILLTFWFFASMTLILGFYGSSNLVLGPNSSRILRANSWFVQDIQVKAEEGLRLVPTLYGFLEPPPLDVLTTWSENRNVSMPSNFHQEWIYYLNEGAQVEITYSVKSHGTYPLILVIAQGKDDLVQWIERPSHPNITLSWSLIHGNGKIQQTIDKPSDYYIAVGNLNNIEIQVQLTFRIQAVLYNTTGAYYKCSLHHRFCALKLSLQRANVAILTTPAPDPTMQISEWYVKLSYGPRWITYFAGSGLMTLMIFMAFQIFSSLQCDTQENTTHQTAEVTTERRPLLANKDDDSQSLGSSYESVSHDEEDIEEQPATGPELLKDGEINNSQELCAICCDAPRDCFFLPCGHCAMCFTCGTRILDEAGICPICRRKMKKVRKIFAV